MRGWGGEGRRNVLVYVANLEFVLEIIVTLQAGQWSRYKLIGLVWSVNKYL